MTIQGIDSSRFVNTGRTNTSIVEETARSFTRKSTAAIREKTAVSNIPAKVLCSIYASNGLDATVGICFLDFGTGELILSNIADTQTYVRTIHKLNIYAPTEVILPTSYLLPNMNKLATIVKSNLPTTVKISGISKKNFDPTEASTLIKSLSLEKDELLVDVNLADKYLSLGAAGAAVQYMRQSSKFSSIYSKLRVKYNSCESTTLIDSRTINSLELVNNALDPKYGLSLFKFLNNCSTKMGERVLRNNILQPLTDVESIKFRLDAVQELRDHEPLLGDLRGYLKQTQDLDRLFSFLITTPKEITSASISDQKVNNIILLKQAMELSKKICVALESSNSTLLQQIRDICGHNDIVTIQDLINEYINEDCTWASGSLDLKNQKCYAVRSGRNGLLEISRELYKSIIDDVIDLISNVSDEYEIPLDYKFDSGRGFFIKIKETSGTNFNELAAIFINKIKRKNYIECTTMDIMKYNSRLNDALSEILLMSDQTIEELIESVDEYLSTLYMVAEALGLLDLLCCFAYNATTSFKTYICPEFSDKIAIKQSRHPILETQLKGKFIANDIYSLKETSRLQIITGANMSGKSVYLRQLCYLVIMAQIGSFLPADYAMLPIYHNIHARICNDTIELNASTFSQEMSDMAYILQEVNEKTLLIIDELGRGSSFNDGFSIALAIAEHLIPTMATIIMSTHFHDIPGILKTKPGVVPLHMSVDMTGSSLNMQYKLVNGCPTDTNYGIRFAENSAIFPGSLIDGAKVIADKLKLAKANSLGSGSSLKLIKKRKLMLDLHSTLKHLMNSGIGNERYLLELIKATQNKFIEEMCKIDDPTEPDDDVNAED